MSYSFTFHLLPSIDLALQTVGIIVMQIRTHAKEDILRNFRYLWFAWSDKGTNVYQEMFLLLMANKEKML